MYWATPVLLRWDKLYDKDTVLAYQFGSAAKHELTIAPQGKNKNQRSRERYEAEHFKTCRPWAVGGRHTFEAKLPKLRLRTLIKKQYS